MNSHKELIVWQKSMDLVELVYVLANKLPKSEEFGLASQLKRCSVSIPSNIAEGFKRGSKKTYIQYLLISNGSAAELETQVEIVKRVFAIDVSGCEDLLLEVQKMLSVLISKLKGGGNKK